jgi:hypothetical protein
MMGVGSTNVSADGGLNSRMPSDIAAAIQRIMAMLCRDSERVFQRLLEKTGKLAIYHSLLRDLESTDVQTNHDYQRRYNGFYKVRGRSTQWRAEYYRLLEAQKQNRNIRFGDVIRELHIRTNRVEPSFASKLAATIRPELPVYDVVVCGHMGVTVPPPTQTPQYRIDKLITEHERMIKIVDGAVKTDAFKKLRIMFDARLSAYIGFTATKKLDLMLWQSRSTGDGRNR